MNFIKKHNVFMSKTGKDLCTWAIYKDDIIIMFYKKKIIKIEKGKLTEFQKQENYNVHFYRTIIKKSKYESKEEFISILKKKHNKYKKDANQIKHIIDLSRFNNINKAVIFYAYLKGIKKHYDDFEPLTELETIFIENAKLGGMIQAKEGEYENVINYDVNSMYPYIMSLQYFKIPMKQGEFKILDELPTKFIPYGIYRAKITRPNKNHKSFFAFKKSDCSFYTSIDLTVAREQGLNIELVQDGKFNALLYGNDKRINSHNIFKKYVDKFYKLKCSKEYKNNKLVKVILNILWGELVRKVYKYADLGYDINDEGNIDGQKIKVSNIDFEYRLARMKPFITAYGRQIMHKLLQDIPYDKVYRIHTDSILCDDSIKLPISDKLGGLKIEWKSTNIKIIDNTKYIRK